VLEEDARGEAGGPERRRVGGVEQQRARRHLPGGRARERLLRDDPIDVGAQEAQDGPDLAHATERDRVRVARAGPGHDAPRERVRFGDRRRARSERGVDRDLEHVGPPEEPVAPSSRRRVQPCDAVRDVLPRAEGRVRQPAQRLIHPHDVGVGGEGLAVPVERRVCALDPDPVVEEPLHHAVGLGIAPLPPTLERDHEGLRVGDHPVVLVFGEPEQRDERVAAAERPRCARHPAPEDLELVVQDVRPVFDPERCRRVEPDVLGALRAESTLASGPRVAHLERRAVDAEELHVRLGVEGAPVVPSLCVRRTHGLRSLPCLAAPLVHRPRDLHPDVGECILVGIQARLVPFQEQVVLNAWVMRLGEPVDQGWIHVAVHGEPHGRQPSLLERDVRADLRLRLDEQVAVHVEAVDVGPRPPEAPDRVLARDHDQDRVVEERVHGAVHAVRGRDEVADHLHDRVGALFLVAVDVGLDEDRDLDVVADLIEEGLRLGRIGEHQGTELEPVGGGALPSLRIDRVHDHAEHVARGDLRGLPGRLADHLVGQPVADAGSESLLFELHERALDRLDRHERERLVLLVRDARSGSRGGAPLFPVGRPEPGRDRIAVPRRCELGARRWGDRDGGCERDAGGEPGPSELGG